MQSSCLTCPRSWSWSITAQGFELWASQPGTHTLSFHCYDYQKTRMLSETFFVVAPLLTSVTI